MDKGDRSETMVVSQLTAPTASSQQHQLLTSRGLAWGILQSYDDGASHLLVQKTTLGRSHPCNIIIDDSRISGTHFEMYCDEETLRCSPAGIDGRGHSVLDGGDAERSTEIQNSLLHSDASPSLRPYGTSYWIRDRSTNGTFVNHRRVGRGRTCRIRTGDDIGIVLLPPPTQAGHNEQQAQRDSADGLLESGTKKRMRSDDGQARVGICGVHPAAASSPVAGRTYLHTFTFHAFAAPPPVVDITSPPLAPLWPHATPPVASRDDYFGPPGQEHRQAPANMYKGAAAFCDSQQQAKTEEVPMTWQWGKLIGQGAQSQVFQAIHTVTGQMMAVKVLKDLTVEVAGNASATSTQKKVSESGAHFNEDADGQDAAQSSPPTIRSCSQHESPLLPPSVTRHPRPNAAAVVAESDPLQVDEEWDSYNGSTLATTRTMKRSSGSHVAQSTAFAPPSRASSTASSPGIFLLDRSESVIYRRPTGNGGSQIPGVTTTGEDNQVSLNECWGVSAEQRAELTLLQSLRHRRIVQYLGFAVQDKLVCILLEYVAGGSLQSLIKNFCWFAESVVRIYALQILQGIEYLHHHHVLHGDIKPANILVSDRGQIKLSDFGTGKILRKTERDKVIAAATHERMSSTMARLNAAVMPSSSSPTGNELLGTPLWMSPEFARTGEASFASDIWAFGCVVLEMATGKIPWSEHPEWSNPATALFNIAHASKGPSLAHLRDSERESSDELVNFLQQTFTVDPMQRPTASQLLLHPFLVGSSASTSVTTVRDATAAVVVGAPVALPADRGVSLMNATQKFSDHLRYLREQHPAAGTAADSSAQSGLTALVRDL